MMKQLIYRKDNISVAFKNSNGIKGCNLFIWYGYSEKETIQTDFIFDASLIKSDMKADLDEFDHHCFDIGDNEDIVDSMVVIGDMIYAKAMSHILLDEIIIEDIYGDTVVIRADSKIIQKKYLFNSFDKDFFFVCNDENRHCLFGLPFKEYTITCPHNITIDEMYRIIAKKHSPEWYYISDTDAASSVSLTYFKEESSPKIITIRCIEQQAHQINNKSLSDKCQRLHGHTYQCCVSVNNSSMSIVTQDYVIALGERIRNHLRNALNSNTLITTTENIAKYICSSLEKDYKIVLIELWETPNIKTRIYI